MSLDTAMEPTADTLPALGPSRQAVLAGTRSRLVVVRPITREDRRGLQTFVRSLSPASRYARFQSGVRELSEALLIAFTDVDQRSHVALVAHAIGDPALIAEARYALDDDGTSAEFAVAVADTWQGQGLGTRLLDALIGTAQSSALARLDGDVLRTNAAMLALAASAGFEQRWHADARMVRVTRSLAPAAGLASGATTPRRESLAAAH
jgi:acetyltransferase